MLGAEVIDIADCAFYHSIDVPGFGLQQGDWDLRANVDAYLSSTDFRGKRVLDVGTSDGYLSVELEKRGADVIALDLEDGVLFDKVPGHVEQSAIDAMLARRRRLANAFALVQRQCGATAKRVHGHAGNLPPEIGSIDYVFIGNVLQHLQDPMQALTSAARVATDGIIVTEANWNTTLDPEAPVMYLLTPQKIAQRSPMWCFHWWQVTPGLVTQWLAILGFTVVERYEHRQLFVETGAMVPHFTIVARRE